MTKLSERLRLNLTDTLTGYVKLAANLFQCARTAVIQPEAKPQNLLLSLRQGSENLLQLLLQKRIGCRLRRNRNVVILNEVAKMGVLLLTDRRFQRYRLLRNLDNLTHSLDRNVHAVRNLLRRRFAAKLLQELSGNTNQLVDGLHHVNRNTNRSCLIGNGSCDRLTDPPGCIRRELEALAEVEFLYCLDQAKISLLNEVKEQHAAANVTLCNRDHQS